MNNSKNLTVLAFAVLLTQLPANAAAELALSRDFTQIQQGLAAGFASLERNANPKVRRTGKTDSWDQARKACAELEPGTWDLPTDSEYFDLVARGAVDVGMKFGEDSKFYPMWIRADSDGANARHFAGKGLIVGLQDGKGYDMFPLDVSPAGVVEMRKAAAEFRAELDAQRHRSEEEENEVAGALASHQKANPGSWLNPDVPHPGVFSDEVNRLLEKPSKDSLVKARDAVEGMIEAVQNGYPVYCIAQ